MILNLTQNNAPGISLTRSYSPRSTRDRTYHTITLSHYHTITLSHYHTIALSHYHTITLSHYHTITLSHYHAITLSHYHTITLSHYHTITLSHYHTITLLISHYHTYHTITLSHPPGPTFRGRCLHYSSINSWNSWNSVGAEKVGVGKISPRAFRRHIVRCWHPLGCRAIDLGKLPQGVRYTPPYTVHLNLPLGDVEQYL